MYERTLRQFRRSLRAWRATITDMQSEIVVAVLVGMATVIWLARAIDKLGDRVWDIEDKLGVHSKRDDAP